MRCTKLSLFSFTTGNRDGKAPPFPDVATAPRRSVLETAISEHRQPFSPPSVLETAISEHRQPFSPPSVLETALGKENNLLRPKHCDIWPGKRRGAGRIGGKGEAGPGEGSGAAEQQDGVCLTTVRRDRRVRPKATRRDRLKRRSQPSSNRDGKPRPFPTSPTLPTAP